MPLNKETKPNRNVYLAYSRAMLNQFYTKTTSSCSKFSSNYLCIYRGLVPAYAESW